MPVRTINILFTCAGRRTYLLKYFRENMADGDKIIATDMQLSAPALQVADVRLQVPAVYDPDYINILSDICKEYKIDALLSLNDLELPVLARNKARFEAVGGEGDCRKATAQASGAGDDSLQGTFPFYIYLRN